jgi:hypothetical protein
MGVRGILFIGAAIAVLGAIGALVLAWLASRGTGFRPILRGGVSVVGSDTGAGHSVLLTDPLLGLRGRPDYLGRRSRRSGVDPCHDRGEADATKRTPPRE